MKRVLVAAVLFVMCALSGPAAWAEADIQLAKKYFTLGSDLFNRGDYREALVQFEKSFKYSSRPELHYNMARCHELLGQHARAIELYQDFLTSEPDNAETIRSRITNLEQLVAQKKAAQKKAATSAPAKDVGTSRPGKSRPNSSAGAMSVAGWSLVGVGGAALVAGAVLGGMAISKESELEQAYAGGERTLAEIQDGEATGEALQTGAIVSLAVGGAAAAAGAVLLILNATGEAETSQAWIAPAPGRSGGMVAAGFSW